MSRQAAPATPPNAPPAISPDAMITPRSSMREPRAPPTFSDRLPRKCARNPPTSAGVFSSGGRYIPSAKINAGTPNISMLRAMAAPAANRM